VSARPRYNADSVTAAQRIAMHRSRFLRALLGLLLTGITAGTGAAGPWYTVELVIFANEDPSARSSQSWRKQPQLPDTSLGTPLSAGSDEVRALGPDSYKLAGVWQELRISGQYRPLRHIAWRQVGTSESRAPLVQIGDGPQSSVYGTVRMVRSRFLHLHLDLLVEDGEGQYRIRERRKMSPNELHYIDHPLVGILARVTRG
jgi:hypothetical protein